jgi:thymidylate synthase
MATIISGCNCFQAWQNVVNYLIGHAKNNETNIIVTIDSPTDFSDLKRWTKLYNPQLVDPESANIRQVINTIFPYALQSYFSDRRLFYSKYEAIYRKGHNRKWGTYFQRLISFGKGFETGHINQLENAIMALRGDAPQKYFITFHLTASNIESNIRPLGGPCWQYGELTINEDNSVDLIAIYRNHDYLNKALGNFIGLAKLLEFICSESGREPGKIIIHSIHAYSSKAISKLSHLISKTN